MKYLPSAWSQCIDYKCQQLVIQKKYKVPEESHKQLVVVLLNLKYSINKSKTNIHMKQKNMFISDLISLCLYEYIPLDYLQILRHPFLKSNVECLIILNA